jgi:hypothetical protein
VISAGSDISVLLERTSRRRQNMDRWTMLRDVGIDPPRDELWHTEEELAAIEQEPSCSGPYVPQEIYDKAEVRLERDIHHLVVELKALRRARHYEAHGAGHRCPGYTDREGLS